jgi:hypothetical protein
MLLGTPVLLQLIYKGKTNLIDRIKTPVDLPK